MAEADANPVSPLSALSFMTGVLLGDGRDGATSDESEEFDASVARHTLMSPVEPRATLRRSEVRASEDPDDTSDSGLGSESSELADELLPPLTWELSRCLEFDAEYDADDLADLGTEGLHAEDSDDADDEESVASSEEPIFTEGGIVNLAADASSHSHLEGDGISSPVKETIAEAWAHIRESAEVVPVTRATSTTSSSVNESSKSRRRKSNARFGSTGSIPQAELYRLVHGESYVPPRLSPLTHPPTHLELDSSGRLPHALRASYHEEEVSRAISATVLMCPLFGFLQMVFMINDQLYFSTAPFYSRLVLIRLSAVTFFFLVALRAYMLQRTIESSPKNRTDDPWVSNARIILTWATFGGATANTELIILSMPNPATSPYWVGFTLILLSLFMTRPFSYRPLIEFACCIVFQHLFLTWWFDPMGAREPSFPSRAVFLLAMVVVGAVGSAQLETLRRQEFLSRKDLRRQKDWSNLLLHSVLPSPIARELEASGRVVARDVEDATILFSDFVGFTSISAVTSAKQLVKALDRLFAVFDIIISRHRLEKLKTIGDAYMCAAGLVDDGPAEADAGFLNLVQSILAGLEMIGWLQGGGFRPRLPFGSTPEEVWKIRIGIHRGPVTAGVIGRSRFAFDCWGSTVNIASRLESSSMPGKINIAAEVFRQVEHLFEGTHRGAIPVKNLPFGEVEQTFIDRIKPEYSMDLEGKIPNALFWEVAKRGPRLPYSSCLTAESRWRGFAVPVVQVPSVSVHLDSGSDVDVATQ
ncbi:hypothetical protein DFJ74DRAFT_671233 [Hyaloraphidium curvatum]|nr:hypothetical protein DFJ74DRAFT_671233 [Hyaloraphidium curvatum]